MSPFSQLLNTLRNNDFIHAVFITIANRGIIIALATLSSVLVARGLGPEARGDFAYVTSMIAIISQFGLLGMHSANVVFASKSPEKATRLFANSILVGGCGSLLVAILGVLWDHLYGPARLHEYICLVVFTVVFQSVLLLIQQLSLGLQKIKLYNCIDLVPQVFAVFCVASFFIFSNMTIKKMLIVNAASPAAGIIICIYGLFYFINTKGCFNFDFSLFRDCFKYGWRIYIACILIAYFGKIEILSAGSRISSKQLGEYAVAFACFSMALVPAQIIGNILLPKLASLASNSRLSSLLRTLKISVPLLSVLNLMLYGFADFLIVLLYGDEYSVAVDIFKILLLGYLPFSISSLLSSFISVDLLPPSLLMSYLTLVTLKGVTLYYSCISIESLAVINVVFNYLLFIMLSSVVLLKTKKA